MAQSAAPNNPFIKQLVHNDRQVRDKAVASLRTFLSRNTPFSDLDFLKLWKGLFYCMWSCDKPSPQRRLALDLSSLVSLLTTPENFVGFVRAFWVTMAREYTGIDSLRMDKFLFLIRAFVNAGFAFCAKGDWKNQNCTKEYLDVLREVPLNPRDPKVPNGLKYHVVDVYVDELEKVVGDEGQAPFEDLLAPMAELADKAVLKSVRKKADEAMEDERVKKWLGIDDADQDLSEAEDEIDDDDEQEDEDEEFGGFDD